MALLRCVSLPSLPSVAVLCQVFPSTILSLRVPRLLFRRSLKAAGIPPAFMSHEDDLPEAEILSRIQKHLEYDMATYPDRHDRHYHTHHRGTEEVPYGGVLGVTADGVPVMSNGDEFHFSNEESPIPGSMPLCCFERKSPFMGTYTKLGYKWQCVEFVRRYLAARYMLWLVSIPTAEDIWVVENPILRLSDATTAKVVRVANDGTGRAPRVGDIVVWSRSEEVPFGHVAIVVDVIAGKAVCVAEQNQGFERWPAGVSFSRDVPMRETGNGTAVELVDEDPILGWMSIEEPLYDFTTGDLADHFRLCVGPGSIVRIPVAPDTSLPWINPSASRCDFFLKRSLTVGADTSDGARADERDVPGAFYFIDYDMFCRIGRAARSLHRLAMEATARILADPDANHLLEHYFGVPPEIQPLLRHSWELTPPLGGRFDFGYDGEKLAMLEYNCDSSGALLECCRTQEKMAEHYGVRQGMSTGSFLGAKCATYFERMRANEKACPKHMLIHFMIDNDDEERYTAMCMMEFAEKAGFRSKLCVGVADFHFREGSPIHAAPQTVRTDDSTIVDLDGEEVLLVWKSWSWDTVLHQYAEQKASGITPETPSLSDLLLNNNVRVLEPLWKTITGSKAILPYMYALAPDHEYMLPASFARTKEVITHHHISKPVNGRAGQNIVMHDPVTDEEELRDAPELVVQPMSTAAAPLIPASFAMTRSANQSFDRENESSPGRFFDSVLVYQQRLFLKKFNHKFFPIFCGWMIGDEFGGIVVREDTSKITKLASVVIPARVVRNNEPLGDVPISKVLKQEK